MLILLKPQNILRPEGIITQRLKKIQRGKQKHVKYRCGTSVFLKNEDIASKNRSVVVK